MLAARNRLITPQSASASIAYSDVGAGTKAFATSWSYTHSGIAGNCILAFISAHSGGTPTFTVKVGGSSGTSMTQVGSIFLLDSSFDYLAVFKLISSGLTGNQTIYASCNTSSYTAINTVSYSNVTTVGSLVTNSGTGTSVTLSLSPTGNQLGVAAFGVGNSFAALSSVSPNSRFNLAGLNSSNYSLAVSDGTSSFSATAASSVAWGAAGVVLS